jgi:hypothetical protein
MGYAMSGEHTTVVVQRYLDDLGQDSPAEPIVRALLDRSVRRLHLLCARLLYRSYPRLTLGPAIRLQRDLDAAPQGGGRKEKGYGHLPQPFMP